MAVLEVGLNKKYHRICDAILDSSDNDVINILLGIYEESFEITKKIKLNGISGKNKDKYSHPLIINNYDKPILISSDCEICNLSFSTNIENETIIAVTSNAKFYNCTVSGAKEVGISITSKQKENRAIFDQININNCYVGILANKKASVSLNNCKIHDCETNGIMLLDKSKIILNECQIYSCEEGIYFTDKSSGILCESELFKNKENGINSSMAADIIVQNCNLYKNNNLGLFLSDKSFIRVYDSKIHDNKINSIIAYDDSTFSINSSEVYNNGVRLFKIEENAGWKEAFPKNVKNHVQKILYKLNKEDLEIIKMYFGLDEKSVDLTIGEVSLFFNISVKKGITIVEKAVSLAITTQNSWS